MPNRILREGITSSDAIDALSPGGEVFFYRLLVSADDHGRFDGRPAVVLARLFPLKLGRVDLEQVSGWLSECEQAGLIVRYQADGKPYLFIPKFGQHARSRSKYPDPPDTPATQLHSNCTAGATQLRPYSDSDSDSKSDSKSCPEPGQPAAGPADKPVMTFPVAGPGSKEWGLAADKVREWAEAYPHLDVMSQMRLARQWVIDHPARRKTAKGMVRYLAGWLARSQDSPRRGGVADTRPPPMRAADCQDSIPPRTRT